MSPIMFINLWQSAECSKVYSEVNSKTQIYRNLALAILKH